MNQTLEGPAGYVGEKPDLRGEKVTGTTARRLAALILGACTIVILANIPARWYLRHFNWTFIVADEKWRLLRELPHGVDWLVLGDSSGMMGVYPPALESAMGGSAVNLCRHSLPVAVEDSWMLQDYIGRLGPPRHLLLVYCYNGLSDDVSPDGLAPVPLSWGFWRRWQPSLELSWEELFHLYALRTLPVLTYPEQIARPLVTPWNAFQEMNKVVLHADGYLETMAADPDMVQSLTATHLATLSQVTRFTEVNRRGLVTMLDLSKQYGFDVYLAAGPVYEKLAENHDFAACYARLHEDLSKLLARYPNAHYLMGGHLATFRLQEMQNDVHLTLPAARVYTASLCDAIRTGSR